jgi:hypothetical protein
MMLFTRISSKQTRKSRTEKYIQLHKEMEASATAGR